MGFPDCFAVEHFVNCVYSCLSTSWWTSCDNLIVVHYCSVLLISVRTLRAHTHICVQVTYEQHPWTLLVFYEDFLPDVQECSGCFICLSLSLCSVFLSACMFCACMHRCVYVCACGCVHACVCVCVCVYICMYVCACVCVCVHLYMHIRLPHYPVWYSKYQDNEAVVCAYTDAHRHTYAHTYTHIHTHTHRHTRAHTHTRTHANTQLSRAEAISWKNHLVLLELITYLDCNCYIQQHSRLFY